MRFLSYLKGNFPLLFLSWTHKHINNSFFNNVFLSKKRVSPGNILTYYNQKGSLSWFLKQHVLLKIHKAVLITILYKYINLLFKRQKFSPFPDYFEFRDFRDFQRDNFKFDLQRENWDSIYKCNEVNESYSRFLHNLFSTKLVIYMHHSKKPRLNTKHTSHGLLLV